MKNKMPYLILSAKDFIQLQKNVNDAIADGYNPTGALCHCYHGADGNEIFAQTMMLNKCKAHVKDEPVTINGWDTTCIEYALAAQQHKYQDSGDRQDILLATQIILDKLRRLIRSAENELPAGEKLSYSVRMTAVPMEDD
jgi:hypothetical protein